MTAPEHLETVVIGAGQAGLSVGHHLAKRGRPFVILDADERVGDNWRRHWDSLRLFSPARLDGLPGMAFPAPGWSFPTKDETADYLERYAERFELPVRGGTRVERIARDGEGYLVECDDGQIAADNVVVATGTFGRPFTPAFAGELDPRIVQLHSSEYQRPSLLLDGPVLVVGASHSGADVAIDVAPTHRTILAGRDTGQAPVDIESRRGRVVWRVLAFLARRVLTLKTPIGRKWRPAHRTHGGLLRPGGDSRPAGASATPGRRLRRQALLDDGTVRLTSLHASSTGWIDLPVCDEDAGARRGVVPEAPGCTSSGWPTHRRCSAPATRSTWPAHIRDAHAAPAVAATMLEPRHRRSCTRATYRDGPSRCSCGRHGSRSLCPFRNSGAVDRRCERRVPDAPGDRSPAATRSGWSAPPSRPAMAGSSGACCAFLARRVLTLETPMGRKMRSEIRSHGGPLLRHRRADLEAAGVERTTARVAGVRDGRPLLDDGTVLDVANVVWCTGFRQDFGWIDLPVCDEDGWPREERGVVPEAPGPVLLGPGLPVRVQLDVAARRRAGRGARRRAHRRARGGARPPSPLPVRSLPSTPRPQPSTAASSRSPPACTPGCSPTGCWARATRVWWWATARRCSSTRCGTRR